ncbi:cysteine--tRNA ligase [bacterium]|nr:MAG: cysteine--tRNA ligase [bacterium]
MPIRIYNTQTGKKEEFKTVQPGKVGMYVCGVTVYDLCHIGHARSAVVFDVIYRYLKYSGLETTYVRNFTDVDDKIIKRANEQKISSTEVSEKYIAAFYEDMDAIGVLRPDVEPKATGHIEEMVAHIVKLIEMGHAYEVNGDVYFSVDSFRPYGRLSGRNLDEMMVGARVDVDERKKNPLDFALWKSAKPGEPFWPSPWGDGRPGWHIECSVMSQKYLGETLDIHGGGKDLVFPHHENEVAQAEAVTNKPFANYWMHNGFVNIDKEKMSKSLGNFFTIRDVLKAVNPEVLRFFLLSHHYRSPVDYSDQSLKDARAGLEKLYRFIEKLEGRLPAAPKAATAQSDAEKALAEALEAFRVDFCASMDDDFNAAGAIGHLHKFANAAGGLIEKSSPDFVADVYGELKKITGVLGLFTLPAKEYFAHQQSEAKSALEISPEEIDTLVAERAEAKKAKNFARADEIRKLLLDKNVILEDGPQGTSWKVKAD